LCSWIVLVAEVDERRLVRTLTRSGLAPRPSARRVKGRSKPARGGKAASTVAGSPRSRVADLHLGEASADGGESLGRGRLGTRRKPWARPTEPRAQASGTPPGAGERALVEGRRPGSDEAVVFDETIVKRGLVVSPGGLDRKVGSRARGAATEDVRGRACRLGTRQRTPRPGGVARRSVRSMLRQDRAAPCHSRDRAKTRAQAW
jgi:hypothetical protein